MDLGNLPSYVTAAHSGFNPGLLVGSKVYVIGMLGRPEGINGTGTTIGICDLRLKKWTWVRDPSPDAPYMNGNVVFLVDDWLYCHGGYVGNNFLSDKMFRLDLTTLEWSTLVTRGMKPPGLVWHAGQYLERHNKYVCFSGQLMRNRMAAATHEVSVNHVSQMKWYKPQVKGHVPALQGAASCLVVEKIFFFGGLDSQWHGLETDLHILESQDKSWMNLNWTSVDLGIGLSCGSLKYINGYLLIFWRFRGEFAARKFSLYMRVAELHGLRSVGQ